jgi:hypothetical protein
MADAARNNSGPGRTLALALLAFAPASPLKVDKQGVVCLDYDFLEILSFKSLNMLLLDWTA